MYIDILLDLEAVRNIEPEVVFIRLHVQSKLIAHTAP